MDKHIKNFNYSKRLSQIFLINKDVAIKEAEFAFNKNVLEMGTGLGILTEELSKQAKSVVSIEIESNAFNIAKRRLNYKNLNLVRGDFFSINFAAYNKFDIFISNIPYL